MARPCWESRLPALPALSGPRQCGAEARGRGKGEVCSGVKLLMRGRSPPPPPPKAGGLGAVGAARQRDGAQPERDGSGAGWALSA